MKKYQVVPYTQVQIDNGFWQERQKLNHRVTIFSIWNRFVETGRFSAFRMEWKEGMPNKPHCFYDSDVAKWIEAAAYILQKEEDKQLEAIIDDTVELIEQHQSPDGYFNIWFLLIEPERRFQDRSMHELYCAGHLMEAAVAYYQATGKDTFLCLMRRYADYIDRVFRQEQAAAFQTPGHEEIELALVKLYRCTGEKRYLELSKWFLDQRGNNAKDAPNSFAKTRYAQDHLPVRQQKTAEGHAVRGLYLYSAMADVAYETEDAELLAACRAIFRNITSRRMYITGATGSSRRGEAFTKDYDLPNGTAYAESCAAIALAMFSRRMQRLERDSRYGDVIEQILYNGFLSSTSLDGKSFFYENPLEIDLSVRDRDVSVHDAEQFALTQRMEVFICSCCPPNIARFVASIGDYLYTYTTQEIYIEQYVAGVSSWTAGTRTIQICQQTSYPRDGHVRLELKGAKGMTLGLRIPHWCRRFELWNETEPVVTKTEQGYALLSCEKDHWVLNLQLRMEPEWVEASPSIHANSGRAALRRGPVLYCLEGKDNQGAVHNLVADAEACLKMTETELSPFPMIETAGWQVPEMDPEADTPYQPVSHQLLPRTLQFIPYYTFANRGESDMLVWCPIRK